MMLYILFLKKENISNIKIEQTIIVCTCRNAGAFLLNKCIFKYKSCIIKVSIPKKCGYPQKFGMNC